MKTIHIVLLGIVGAFVFTALMTISWLWGTNNSLIAMDEGVKTSWSQVENVYQRRADLIPNLVEVVSGYAKHEKGTLEGVIAARASATQVKVDISTASPEQIAKFQAAQGQLTQALGRLMMVTEQYPNLKANEGFLDLQKQIEGTENRITVERMKFNDVTKTYNVAIRQFPSSFVASFKGMTAKPYFEADQGAKTAPKVKF